MPRSPVSQRVQSLLDELYLHAKLLPLRIVARSLHTRRQNHLQNGPRRLFLNPIDRRNQLLLIPGPTQQNANRRRILLRESEKSFHTRAYPRRKGSCLPEPLLARPR